MPTVIGLDVGHSAVKMVVRGASPFRTTFKAIAIPAIEIVGDTTPEQTLEDTVDMDGKAWFVGETAHAQRDLHVSNQMGLHGDWVSTPQYEALVRGALRKAELRGNDLSELVVVHGLPQVDLNKKKAELDAVLAKVAPHAKSVVLSQPMGAFYAHMLDQDANPIRGDEALDEAWALIDVGYYTTDFVLLNRGRRIERASGSAIGVNAIITDACQRAFKAKQVSVKPERLIEAIEKGTDQVVIKILTVPQDLTVQVNEAIRAWYTSFIDSLQTKIQPYIEDIDGIVVSGGGAPLLYPLLREKWPHVFKHDDSRYSVSEGYARFGLMLAAEHFPTPANEEAVA